MKVLIQYALPVLLAAIPPLAAAHPGHGIGTLDHGLQHALWNMLGFAVLAALVLIGDTLWDRYRNR